MFHRSQASTSKVSSMNASNDWEIYIPTEAEVMSIPLWSLPNSILKRMDLPVPGCVSSGRAADSPRVVWICPAVIGRKSQGPASRQEGSVAENIRSLLGTEVCSRLDSMQMSFVSSNRAAWEVLKDVSPSGQSRRLPEGSAPSGNQNAIVIFHGRLYLCVRRGGSPASGPRGAASSRSDLSSSTPHKELRVGGKNKVEKTSSEVKKQVKKGSAVKRKEASSVRATQPAPRPSTEPGVDVRSVKVARREQAPDEPASACVPPLEEQQDPGYDAGGEYEMRDPGEEEAAGGSWNDDSDLNTQRLDGDSDQSSSHSWMTRQPPSASLQLQCDFSELERDENIAQLKAKYNKMVSSL